MLSNNFEPEIVSATTFSNKAELFLKKLPTNYKYPTLSNDYDHLKNNGFLDNYDETSNIDLYMLLTPFSYDHVAYKAHLHIKCDTFRT